jgi:hypothetical protein
MNEILLAIAEIQQPRSKFQLEKFVIGQHPTLEMQYYQTLIELEGMLYEQKVAIINLRKLEIKIARLLETNDELDALEAEELALGQDKLKLGLIGIEREIEHLVSIWQAFPVKFTREQIEEKQLEYWQARFHNNAEAMVIGTGGINPAHIESMKQAGVFDTFVNNYQLMDVKESNAIRNLEA